MHSLLSKIFEVSRNLPQTSHTLLPIGALSYECVNRTMAPQKKSAGRSMASEVAGDFMVMLLYVFVSSTFEEVSTLFTAGACV